MADDTYDPRLWDRQWMPVADPGGGHTSSDWGVIAWDRLGRSCSMRGPWGATVAGAIERAEQFKLHGDVDGKMYEHVEVVLYTARTCVRAETMTLDEARQML